MKRKRALSLGALLSGLLALLAAFSSIVGNLASNILSDAVKPLLPYTVPVFVGLALISIILAVWQFRQQEIPGQETTEPVHLLPAALAAQYRQRLLAKVRSFWVNGVLENSLHSAALMVLELQEQPDAVARPWQLVLQEIDQSTRPLPYGTRITQVYEKAVGELLILGEPGSGKTTLLLELARDLLDRAEKDEHHPMPIVFNLSSWAVKQQPLAEWLVDEMNIKYQVPRSLGQTWIATDRVLPLLDGLDEVRKEYRLACIDAINTYRLQHGLVPMVTCSRRAEYFNLTTRLLLQSAVVVQPLNEMQIDAYLSNAGEKLEAIRMMFHEDQTFQELATTPLMLTVLALAYNGKTIKELEVTGSLEMRQRYVFEMYVERMLQRRGNQVHYSYDKTKYWLTRLAQQLVRQNQTEFYIERMRPGWLPTHMLRKFFIVTILLVRGLSYGMTLGLLYAILAKLAFGNIAELSIGLLFILFIGLSILAIGLMRPTSSEEEIQSYEIQSKEVSIWSYRKPMLIFSLVSGPFLGLVGGPLLGLLFGSVKGVVGGLLLGLVGGLFSGLGVGLEEVSFGEKMDTENIVKPNQGIWNSLQSGLVGGMVFGLTIGLACWLLGGLGFRLLGLDIGLSAGLFFGVDAFIAHFTLRFLLWRADYMPWAYARFLDYASERLLLRKVGGGYIFAHHLLMKYFASLPFSQSPANNVQPQQFAPAQDGPAFPADGAES